MNGQDIYKIWAPKDSKWSNWVRPVPFTIIDEKFKIYNNWNFFDYELLYLKEVSNVALIIDMPGVDSIKEGLCTIKYGFRPIPIYNGTIEQNKALATTDNTSIVSGLVNGAYEIGKLQMQSKDLPAFLLDTNRMNRFKIKISVYDNSWDIYDQDMPTAEYFLKNNINKIIVRSESIQKDLKKILYKYQKKGLQIFITNGFNLPKKITIRMLFKNNIE